MEIAKLIQPYLYTMLVWINTHVFRKVPLKLPGDSKTKIRILDILENEREIQCSKIGFKGRIDTLLEVEIEKPGEEIWRGYIPLELKTGSQMRKSDFAQTLIYCMLVEHELEYPGAPAEVAKSKELSLQRKGLLAPIAPSASPLGQSRGQSGGTRTR